MTPIESLSAIRRLAEVAGEFPGIAPQVTGLIAEILGPTTNGYARNGVVPTNGKPLHGGGYLSGTLIRFDSEPTASPPPDKEWYTQAELAPKVSRGVFTVGRWCREGRIRAENTAPRYGGTPRWRISHNELKRYQASGLLDLNPGRNHP